ncbi:hypothetical protein GALL_310610 [mine drainage metagenome]|uniref:Uncharacterized protein n=1 Tax=mine drainage metagenome TaxID=410659 RepID=A0A1J5R4U6_9ZZZZ
MQEQALDRHFQCPGESGHFEVKNWTPSGLDLGDLSPCQHNAILCHAAAKIFLGYPWPHDTPQLLEARADEIAGMRELAGFQNVPNGHIESGKKLTIKGALGAHPIKDFLRLMLQCSANYVTAQSSMREISGT